MLLIEILIITSGLVLVLAFIRSFNHSLLLLEILIIANRLVEVSATSQFEVLGGQACLRVAVTKIHIHARNFSLLQI